MFITTNVNKINGICAIEHSLPLDGKTIRYTFILDEDEFETEEDLQKEIHLTKGQFIKWVGLSYRG